MAVLAVTSPALLTWWGTYGAGITTAVLPSPENVVPSSASAPLQVGSGQAHGPDSPIVATTIGSCPELRTRFPHGLRRPGANNGESRSSNR